jgi:hypothetical protein
MNLNADILLDNPILVKHIRSRLRRRLFVPAISIVTILCMCILWLGQTGYVRIGMPLALMMGLQVIVIMFIGAHQVGTTMNKVRETGIIDFHRVSPLPSSWLMVGFLLGPPILEYVLLGITLPFALFVAIDSPAGVFGYVQLLISLVLIVWFVHSLVLLSSLVTKKPKSTPRGAATIVVILSLFLGQPIAGGIWFATNSLQDAPTIPFFGIEIYWLLFVVIYALALITMLLVAATRKLRSDRMHAYTKRLAIACQSAIAFLALAAVWHVPWAGIFLAVLYLLVLAGMILTITITPDRSEYLRGLRRAQQMGRQLPSPWTDGGIIRLPLFILCGIVFLAATIILRVSADPNVAARGSVAIALGVFVVAYFGFALQFFLLRIPKAAMGVMALFVFVVWLLPILIGSISAAAGASPPLFQSILAMSPIMGMAMSSGVIETPVTASVQPAALTPAIALAVIFNFLLVATRRKIDLAVRSSTKKPELPNEDPANLPTLEESNV